MFDVNQFQELLPLISGAVGGATAAGIFKGPIKTLEDLWYIKFGHKASDQVMYLKARQATNVEKLKTDMLHEVDKIPLENIQEPKLKILGPALEASAYYIEEEELRMMFAKIIATSLDDRKKQIAHSSFVEIIKQLDVLEAKLLLYFHSIKNINSGQPIPIMRLFLSENGKGVKLALPIIYLNSEFSSLTDNASALTNLERLGLIKINYDGCIQDDTAYADMITHPTVTSLLDIYQNSQLDKAFFTLTDFGVNFIKCCVA